MLSGSDAARPDGTVDGCLFCAIVRGEQAATIVLDEPRVLGFLDARPVFKGHVLLVPRTHVVTLLDASPTVLADVTTAAQRVAGAVVAGLGAQGSFVAMNNVVSQSVPHLHIHVVPRTKGDGLRGFFWPRTRYAEGEAKEYAERIGHVLAG